MYFQGAFFVDPTGRGDDWKMHFGNVDNRLFRVMEGDLRSPQVDMALHDVDSGWISHGFIGFQKQMTGGL